MNQDQENITKCQEENKTFMMEALYEAKKAFNKGEVPVGAVIVKNGLIIGRGHNVKEEFQNAIRHAEIEAINDASLNQGSWRLIDCDIYVTMEPCPMCAGAIIQSRIRKVYYGVRDLKSGAVDSIINLLNFPWNHKVEFEGGILANECGDILKRFFRKIREE